MQFSIFSKRTILRVYLAKNSIFNIRDPGAPLCPHHLLLCLLTVILFVLELRDLCQAGTVL